MNWSKFTLTEGKHILAVPCLEVIAFSYASPAGSGTGFAHVLQTFAGRFGDRLGFYRTGDMKRFRPFVQRALDAPYHWFSDEELLATAMLGFQAHSGTSAAEVFPPAVDLTLMGFDEPPRFVFQVTLPVEESDTPDDLVSFVSEALAEFPLESGHCGYAVLWEPSEIADEEDIFAWLAPLLLRHPGLGHCDGVTLSNAANRGVVTVSWLTFLGPQITTDLGGREGLASRSPPEVSVLPLGNGGTLLRAGAAPQLGDVNRRDMLPVYRAVGQLVAPRRATDEAFEDVVISGMSEETAHDWLRRFFN
jgi:hypothetical protein